MTIPLGLCRRAGTSFSRTGVQLVGFLDLLLLLQFHEAPEVRVIRLFAKTFFHCLDLGQQPIPLVKPEHLVPASTGNVQWFVRPGECRVVQYLSAQKAAQ